MTGQDQCPEGGLHDWIDEVYATEFQAGYLPERRQCGKCNLAQVWRLREHPTARNAPQLGEWEDVA